MSWLNQEAHKFFHWLLLVLFSIWEAFLGTKSKLVARSTWGLVFYLGKRLLKGKKKMKTLFTAFNGAVTLTEVNGVVTLAFDAELGGGEAKGIIDGKGSFNMNAMQGLKLGEAAVIAHIPAPVQPLANVIAGVVNQVVTTLE